MSNPLSSVAKYLTSIWKSDSPKTGRTFSEQKDSCQLATQLVTTNLNQMISDRLPGCSLLKATLEETKDGKLSLLTGSEETIIFSDEKTMHSWLGDKQRVDIWQIKDLREGKSDTFYKLQRKNNWGYNTFETKEKLFDQLHEDYGVFWKLEDQGRDQTSYIQYKTGLFGNRYVEVDHENLTLVANSLKLKGVDLPTSIPQTQDGISWGQGIAACVLGGLLVSAGRSLSQSSSDNPVSDALAMMKGTIGPAAFKAAFAFQMAAMSRQEGGTLSGALLAGMMLLPESVKGQSLCPKLVGSCATLGQPVGIAVLGNYAYVADLSPAPGFQIIDVSSKTNPMFVGSCNLRNGRSVAVSGNYAYVLGGDDGFQIVDVSNVTNPKLLGSQSVYSGSSDVTVSGKYAYVMEFFALQIIDVSNVTNPTLAGSYDKLYHTHGVAVSGNYAYVGDSDSLRIIDVSNVTNPKLVGSYDMPNGAYGIVLSGNYAYVGTGSSGLQIIDVSNVVNPKFVGFYKSGIFIDQVAVSGNYACVVEYIGDYKSNLQIINVSNKANPTLAGSHDKLGMIGGIAISSNYVYVTVTDVVSPSVANFNLRIIDWNLPCS